MTLSRIYLESKIKIAAINKKTTAKVFNNVIVGDILHLSMPIKTQSSLPGYANYILLKNPRTNEHVKLSVNQLGVRLECFDVDVAL